MIVCFSGTGNSMLVAGRLAEALGERVTRVDRAFYDRPRLDAAAGRVVWVAPVYSWGVPPVMADIIGRAPMPADAGHYVVMTCGDDVGRADAMWRRCLSARGCRTAGVYSVIMPNNYTAMRGFDVDSAEVASAKLAAMPAAVDTVAALIAAGDASTRVVRGRFARLKTSVIYPWFIRHEMSPRRFRVLEGCTGCGTCARACPMSNIVLRDRRPVWGDVCAMCLACYHSCPAGAVAWGKATLGKGRYLAPR